MTTTRREELDGFWSDYSVETIDAPLTSARRLIFADGHEEFLIASTAEGTPWSLRLRPRGREFVGSYRFDGEDDDYPVVMRLYRAVEHDPEWLLLGTWENPGVEKTYMSITLFPREPDED
jgi:hypothetical protein